MAPVPVIIGTTLAIVGTGYAFKKFVYDPHLAPLIDALIDQHKQQRREREQRRVPVSVHRPSASEGRSTSTSKGYTGQTIRRRRPAEMYELDESDSRIFNFQDKPKPTPEVKQLDRPPATLITLEEKAVSDRDLPPLPSSPRPPSPIPETHVIPSSPSLSTTSAIVGSEPDMMSDADHDFGLTSPFVDAETYTPRSGSPISPHALSPAFGHLSLGASDFTFPSPNRSPEPSRPSSAPLSVSSWADDEHWRSGSELGSEWDAMSDTARSQ